MKKTISLILAIVLSTTVFVSDVIGITMVVRAEDYVVDEGGEDIEALGSFEETGDDGSDFTSDGGSGDVVDNGSSSDSDSSSNGGSDNNDSSNIEPDEEQKQKLEQQKQEEEELQKMLDELAKEAEEEAKQAEIDAAAAEARRIAEEQAKKEREAAEAAEAARKAAEEANDAQNKAYTLSITLNGTPKDYLDFGSAPIGTERAPFVISISNVGDTPVDLVWSEFLDTNNAFEIKFINHNGTINPGQSVQCNIIMKSGLAAGKYQATYAFEDAFKSNVYGKSIAVYGTVTAQQAIVTGVSISPAKATLAVGNSYSFYANVSGKGNYSQDVKWSVTGNRSTGTYISNNGLLTIASDETSGSLTVIAASASDGSVCGYSTVTPQRNSYNVNVSMDPKKGGQVTGGGAVSQGGSVTLSAVPNKNYYFIGWVRDGKKVSTSTNYTINDIQSNINVTAKFGQQYVNIKAVPNNENGGTVVGGGNVSYGGSTTLSAKAYSGYVFVGWKEGDTVVSRDASLKLKNLTADRKIVGIFEKTTRTLSLSVEPKDTGKVSGGGTVELGKGATIKAEAYQGYEFQYWQVNGQVVSYSAEYKIDKVEQDYTCTAVFKKKGITSFEISAGVATTGGTISPSGKQLVAQGQNMTFTITPKSGFAILAVAVDGNQVGTVGSYTFKDVQGPHTISAAFVQTDAGKEASKSSGKQTQEKKVEVKQKTASNTATTTSTVDVNKAAEGTAGDEFVEEMEGLEEIEIPTDEELGIVEEPVDTGVYSEVTQMLGMSMDEVSAMVAAGEKVPVLDAAFLTGSLGAYVRNEYEPSSMTSVDYSNMTREEIEQLSDDVINPSLPDLDVVVTNLLTTEEVMTLAQGGQVDVSVTLTGQDQVDDATKRVMKSAVGQKPVQYFDLTMLKSANGWTEKITELPSTMEVVIEVPDAVYKSGKTYSIIRVHNGQVSVLPDLDNDPKTVTFRTDKFSSYAIAREVATANGLIAWLVAGAAIAFGIAMSCMLILIAHQNKMRQARRKARV